MPAKRLTGDNGDGFSSHWDTGDAALFLSLRGLVRRRFDAARRGLLRALTNGLARGVASQNDAGVTQVFLAVFRSRNGLLARCRITLVFGMRHRHAGEGQQKQYCKCFDGSHDRIPCDRGNRPGLRLTRCPSLHPGCASYHWL